MALHRDIEDARQAEGQTINKKKIIFAASAGLIVILYLLLISRGRPEGFILGARADNAGAMYDRGMKWFDADGRPKEAMDILREKGLTHFISGITVSPLGEYGFDYVLKNSLRMAKSGLIPGAFLYLSDQACSVDIQGSPLLWSTYPGSEKAFAASGFAENIARDFKSAGLRFRLYSIGHETDLAICGVSMRDDRAKAFEIIKAAADAVRKNDSRAKIMISLGRWWDVEAAVDFFSAAMKYGINADYAGLSFYPQSSYEGGVSTPSIKAFIRNAETISGMSGLPVIASGASYPNSSDGGRSPDPLYPLTGAGQRDWLIDMLAACYNSPAVKGFIYTLPEDYTGGTGNSALFSSEGELLPAADAFRAFGEPLMNAFEYAEKALASAKPAKTAELKAIMDEACFLLRDGAVEEAKFKARQAEYKALQ